jgi:hypothetical protein
MIKTKLAKPQAHCRAHTAFAQFDMRQVIVAHAAPQVGIGIDAPLQLPDHTRGLELVDAVTQRGINQPEQSGEGLVVNQGRDTNDDGLAAATADSNLL